MGLEYSTIRISDDRAAQIGQARYGLKGEVTALHGEVDFNYRLVTESGDFLLKISRPGEGEDKLLFQNGVLDRISRSSVTVLAPEIIPDLHGNQITEIRDDEGRIRRVRLFSWIEGRVWSEVNPISNHLLNSLGQEAGKLTAALLGFDHPGAHRDFEWDLAQAGWTYDHRELFSAEQRSIMERFHQRYDLFREGYQRLRKGVVHNDANDNNIIVTDDPLSPEVKAIIDYGDVVYTQVINDLAIAIAYGVMGKPDPLSAALHVVAGYHSHFPLLEEELEFLHTLVAMRLIISVTKSALNRRSEPENEYLLVSEKPAWDLLKRWGQINEEHALFSFRYACHLSPHPHEKEFKQWASGKVLRLNSLFPTLENEAVVPLDLSVSSPWIGDPAELDDPDHFQYRLNRLQAKEPAKIIAGGYLEPRMVYTSPAYEKTGNSGTENRTVHLGTDFWVPAGTPIHTLFEGEVVTSVNDAGDKEYGGLVILKHTTGSLEFFTLYGHLSLQSLEKTKTGDHLKQGDCIGYAGTFPENGNWVPHLHFQVMLSMLGYADDFPGVIYPGEMDIWKSICPDPNLLFRIPEFDKPAVSDLSGTLAYRKKHLGRSLSLSYWEPLKIARGSGIHLFDQLGRKYLDTVNNVAHVGHEHPEVVKAGQQQMAVLNTNTRYLHDQMNDLARELLDTFPEELSVVHFVNSGSEANELALRMVSSFTGRKDMIAVEVGYHGNSGRCIDVSSYKFDGKGGSGAPENTHVVPLPDRYRGIYRGKETGPLYAGHILEKIGHIRSLGRGLAGFICESIMSCGGQIELPDEYLKLAYRSVREAGGICIADEVQVGCGRVGRSFWGFQLHDVVPDIVTIGKPIGNGHPLAAVVCTPQVADAFAGGMEYFNTFGGNPVSCAIGRAVLRVVKNEGLQAHAKEVGDYLKSELKELQETFPVIGDVRGQGLFLGMELADHNRLPLTEHAAYLVNRMKEHGILMSTDGRDDNVIKIKPPMVFSRDHSDELLGILRIILQEDFMVKQR